MPVRAQALVAQAGTLQLHPPTVAAVARHLSLMERMYRPGSSAMVAQASPGTNGEGGAFPWLRGSCGGGGASLHTPGSYATVSADAPTAPSYAADGSSSGIGSDVALRWEVAVRAAMQRDASMASAVTECMPCPRDVSRGGSQTRARCMTAGREAASHVRFAPELLPHVDWRAVQGLPGLLH
jgi:hypothetical protein